MEQVRELLANDDGKEFVMQNLVRYRPKALYPPGYTYGDDPREADKRYGKAIMGDLLRNGNLLVFVARKAGNFITPEGADNWHYVAMCALPQSQRLSSLCHCIQPSRQICSQMGCH